MIHKATAAIVVAAILLAGCSKETQRPSASNSPTVGGRLPGADPGLTFDPSGFSAKVTNPWFPLPVGRTLVYRSVKDNESGRELLTPSKVTKTIDGVPCRVVFDRLYLNGALEETTRDYYSQDADGNVWYFGEDTAEIDRRGDMVSTEGTWKSGEAGARPGIFMDAQPVVGRSHRQEYYAGHAEDFFSVVDLSVPMDTPFHSYGSTL
ncbi:MAG: hypothetical protein ABR579_05420, partial [Actinomycetota bacterium]